MLFVAVISVPLTWAARWTQFYRKEAQIEHQLRLLGGRSFQQELGPSWLPGGIDGTGSHVNIVFCKEPDPAWDAPDSIRRIVSLLPRLYAPGEFYYVREEIYMHEIMDRGPSTFTDSEIEILCKSDSLWSVSLVGANVGDTAAEKLARLPNLRHLDLSATNITDTGMKHLARCKALRSLKIENTDVTDKGLMELTNLNSLRSVTISHSEVTDQGTKRLAAIRPDIRVFRLGWNIHQSNAIEAPK